jgi:hypothetical protein
VLLDEQSDVLRGGGRRAELMKREVAQRIAAERGERRPDERMTHRTS